MTIDCRRHELQLRRDPTPAPDLDQIPAGVIERVEVVTGGASAAYGSDAIAGVINFIVKKNFDYQIIVASLPE